MGEEQLYLFVKPMIDPKEVKRIAEETLKEEPREPGHSEAPIRPQGHPRAKASSKAWEDIHGRGE